MAEPIRAFIVVDHEIDTFLVETAFPADGSVESAGLVEGIENADAAVGQESADLLIVACAAAAQGVIELIRRALAEQPGRPVVALCESPPEYFVQAAFQAGADDVVLLPETPERVLFALEKALARRSGRGKAIEGGLAPMVCVLGPKGGCGKTVVASNLVVAAAEAGSRAVVVDLDLQFGDVGLALGLDPVRTVYDLATSGGALDAEKLSAYVMVHHSGVGALLAPVRPDQASAVTGQLLGEVYALLRAEHDLVVVDTPPDLTPEAIAAIDASSHVCMVGMLDSLSLKNTKLGLETLELMDYDEGSIAVVLNRADSDVGIGRGDVSEILGRKPNVYVPSDRDVPRSINEGTPIVQSRRRSAVADAFRRLAEVYVAPADASTNGHRRFALLGRSGG